MKNYSKKTFRQTIISSVLIIVMSLISMVGGTFAWFTDTETVSSRIVSGKLDVEMFYNNTATDEYTNIKTMGEHPLFFVDSEGNDILWEPGVVSVCDFKVANVGDLALKYRFDTSFEDYNDAGVTAKLSSVIKAAIIPQQELATRAEAIAAGEGKWTNLAGVAAEAELSAEDSDEFTVVLYWEPTDHDNDYNMQNAHAGKTIGIKIDIKLVAMQLQEEDDTYGTDYDKDATYPGKINQASNLIMDETEPTMVRGLPAGDTSETLIIPATATKIAENAFQGNTNLKEVTMPATIEVGEGAFEGCENLTKVKLVVEDGTTAKINTEAFACCPSLQTFEIDGNSSVDPLCFYGKWDSTWDSLDVVFNGDTEILGAAFAQTGTVLGNSTITFNGDVTIRTTAGPYPNATFLFASIAEIRFAAGSKIIIDGNCTNDIKALTKIVFEGAPAAGSSIDANAFNGAKGSFEGIYIGCSVEEWEALGLPKHFNGESWAGGDVIELP